jgi:hypothetical protein
MLLFCKMCFSRRLQCLDLIQIKGALSRYNVLTENNTKKQITVKFKFLGDKKISFFGHFMSFFTVRESFFESFITFSYSLYEYLSFLCYNLMAKKII